MESVFLSNLVKTDIFSFGAVIKAAYLTTYRVGVFGSSSGMVSDWSVLKTENSRLRRIVLTTTHIEDIAESSKAVYSGLDILKKFKYLSAKDLIAKNAGESLLKEIENSFIEQMNQHIATCKLGFFSALKKDGEPLVSSVLTEDTPGDPPFEKDSVSSSMRLKFIYPGQTPDVFWLEPEFFDPEYNFEMKWLNHPSEFIKNGEMAQLLPVFDLPSTSFLSATETKYLKRELKKEANAWNEAMDPFLNYYLRNKGPEPSSEILDGMVQASKALNDAIARSTLIATSRENDESNFYHPLQVILGFLPTPMLWKFYERHNAVSETTMNMLEDFKSDPAYISHLPVFLVKSKLDSYFEKDNMAGKTFVPVESKAVKKSIEI